jgi:arsenical pump membrane protein
MLAVFHLPALTRTVLIIFITAFTLIGIMMRPWKISEALFALTGAFLLLILGLISPVSAINTLFGEWNTFLFFLGMMGISALAEMAGLFDRLALLAAKWSGSSVSRLFLNIFLLGSFISMLLSNDATALILTPIVYSLVTRLRLPALPFLFACTFIADTASFLLPVSNPINIIVTGRLPLAFPLFLRLLTTPCLVVIAINFGVFRWLYRRFLHGTFDIKRLASQEGPVRHQAYFRYTCGVLGAVAIAYIVAAAAQFPLSVVAVSGAFLLLAGALYWKRVTPVQVGKQISWPIFGFIGGMFIVVEALNSTNLTQQFGLILLHLSGGTPFGAVMIGTLGAAIGTNVINNVPAAVVLSSSLHGIQHTSLNIQQGFTAATIFGCDLGPNLTTVGSLATVFWLLFLRQRNMDVSGLDYFKVGVMVTPLMLLIGALAIWLLLIL